MINKFSFLPEKVIYCRKCVQSNQRPSSSPEHKKSSLKVPTVGFYDGICSACRYYDFKKEINWSRRENEFQKLLNRYRDKGKQYDVIIPGSGGKDSYFLSHLLKTKYDMRPLIVTWAPHIFTNIGIKNYLEWSKVGHDNILVTPNQKVHSLLTKYAFKNLVNPFQPFIIGQKNCAPKIALKYNIKLILYGENQAEAHNNFKDNLNSLMEYRFYTKEPYSDIYLSGKNIKYFKDKYGLEKSSLDHYIPEDLETILNSKIETHFMSYFLNWSPHHNYYYAKRHTPFKSRIKRTQGTYTKFSSLDDKIDGQHYYTMLIKFGQGRTMNDACRDIRDGYLSRDEAISLMKKYDQEFPDQYFLDFLNYIELDKDKYWEIINKSRPRHIWKKNNNSWSLKHPIWK